MVQSQTINRLNVLPLGSAVITAIVFGVTTGAMTGVMAPIAKASLDSSLSMREARSQLLNLEQFPLSVPPASGKLVASSNQLSPTQISEPSLSWIRDQLGKRYGSDRLVDQWQAYQVSASTIDTLSYVDVIVDEQIWGLLSYFERYAFISQFGTAAKQYGYHLRVFHTGDVFNYRDAQGSNSNRLVRLRGANICGFQDAPVSFPVPISPGAASEILCEIVLDDTSRREVL